MSTAVIFSAFLLFAASSFAQPQRGMRKGDRHAQRSPERIVRVLEAKQDELKITDEQLEKAKNLVCSFEESATKTRNANNLQHLELKKLLQEKRDYGKIEAVLSDVSANRNKMFIEMLKLKEEINDILTPEQRDALKEMWQEKWEDYRPFWGRDRMERFRQMRENREN